VGGKLRQTSGRLHSRGSADRRKQSLECGGGGNLLTFDGFRQIAKSQILCGIANPGLIKIIYEPSEEGARARETQT
jgi:hypothetical protein